ncbi:DegT/DnrJ/EryC1/StrS aminotransferase family protein [Pseudarthrobacter sp. NIBRBAC000502771]|uniref:DegT/DnrJ/EryC1/StrS family aminotransferase n=1 Tax=Pseudarthrobacter sp. NIBRBAC000502771 TaxID=2590774 RepID=UPI0011324C20|nr:DegT/DnrJ/EryC1/StrS family aminotransferase [Pseudarthrobacter sp. NIBRBAC000502771]QDG62553.1 UDP-4-amino-4,6-dideoxy-N-acetyl-beta-L-altrosamine transaminase [Pseudarthrobacter sp. NIBRBAC000502771]
MIPYGRQSISNQDIEAVVAVLKSDFLTTGPVSDAFEKEVARVAGASHAISVTSGTAALHVAYNSLNLKKGDEIVTTPLTFVATAATAALQGARIRFADVDPDTGNLDHEAAASEVGERTRAVTSVDYAGQPTDIAAFRSSIASPHVALIQDAAHSIGSLHHDQPVGSQADLTTFSFFPTKNMTTGEGGAVVTNDAELATKCKRFKNHGLVRDLDLQIEPDTGAWHQEVHSFGLNYRLPDVLAALGLSQLQKLQEFKAKRRWVFEFYSEALSEVDGIVLPVRTPLTDPMWHLYPLRVPASKRRAIFDGLRAQGIGVQVNYIPAYWHPVFQDMGYKRGQCPNAELFYQQEISLPMHAELSEQHLEKTVNALKKVLDHV